MKRYEENSGRCFVCVRHSCAQHIYSLAYCDYIINFRIFQFWVCHNLGRRSLAHLQAAVVNKRRM
jgi:hypothetical protein